MAAEGDSESISEWLRLERGSSQQALGGPGMSPAHICRLEADTRAPSPEPLRDLAPELGVTVESPETGLARIGAEPLLLRLTDAELELKIGRDLAGTERAFRAVLEEAVALGDRGAAARAQVGGGLAAFARGDLPAAVVMLEAAVDSGRFSCIFDSEVFTTLARAYVHLGAPRRSIELLGTCLDEIARADVDDSALTIGYSTRLSQAFASVGEYTRAEHVILAALDSLGEDIGALERVHLHWSLARVAEAGGHVATALEHMRNAITLLEVIDDVLFLGRAHVVAATLLMSSGKFIQAGQHLHAADRYLESSADPLDRAFLKIEESRRATGLGSAADGVTLAREALELLGRDNPSFQGAAHCALADALAVTGSRDGALAAFETAIELLEETGQWREAADACTAMGKYLRTLGCVEETVEAFDRAASLASRVRGVGARLLATVD